MLLYWIWLTAQKHFSAQAKQSLLEHFGSADAIYMADETALRMTPNLKEKEICALLDKSLDAANRIIEVCDNKRISVLTWQDAAYPERLRNIFDPPLVLYYEGLFPNFDYEAAFALVGTRHASAYGLAAAKRLGYQLGRAGALVISGAAKGIDALVLEGALTAGRPAVAILGCGTDVIYPRENKTLINDIRYHGCLISEYPPGTSPKPEYFPFRNRIMSGLALGVVVVEAPKKSGALITARHALEQGRDVFTIPGNLGVSSLEGNIALMKEGAAVVENGNDIVASYLDRFPALNGEMIPPIYEEALKNLPKTERPMHYKSTAQDEREAKKRLEEARVAPSQKVDIKTLVNTLNEIENKIVMALKSGPLTFDQVSYATGIEASDILSSLINLETKRYVERESGQRLKLGERVIVEELK